MFASWGRVSTGGGAGGPFRRRRGVAGERLGDAQAIVDDTKSEFFGLNVCRSRTFINQKSRTTPESLRQMYLHLLAINPRVEISDKNNLA